MTTIADRYAAELLRATAHEMIMVTAPDTRPFRSGSVALIAVTCTCCPVIPKLRHHGGRVRREPIEARPRFPAAEAIASYRAWHKVRRHRGPAVRKPRGQARLRIR